MTRTAAVARTAATAVGTTQRVKVSAVELTDDQSSEARTGWAPGMSIAVGQPVRVTTGKSVPPGGVRLTRTYKTPLPQGESATLAFFDDRLGTWHAVPSILSADRLSVSAIVHHLSVWTDIIGAMGVVGGAPTGTISGLADWLYYQVGKVFDTRVDPPACTSNPAWVEQTTFIETSKNNSLLFCTGQDPKHPELLDVKARVNRGFAFNAFVSVPTTWTYNSTFQGETLDDAIAVVGHLDTTLADDMREAAPEGSILVGPGSELSVGVSEDAVRDAAGPTVLDIKPPSSVGFLTSMLGQLVGTQLEMLADGYVAAAMAISGCYTDVKAAHDAGTWARALLTCVGNLDDAAAKELAQYLTKRGKDPVAAGKVAGEIIGRATIYLALIGPLFNAMNYAEETRLTQSARTVSVFAEPEPVTLTTLRTAEVPAACGLPGQRLVNSKTTKGSVGDGFLNTATAPHVFGDFAGLGYRQALAVYDCNAGGVSWPAVLVLIGTEGKLLASLELPGHSEHSDPTAMSVSGTVANIRWDEYEGAGFFFVHHTSRIFYAEGKLVLDHDVATYEPQTVAEDVSVAAFERSVATFLIPAS